MSSSKLRCVAAAGVLSCLLTITSAAAESQPAPASSDSPRFDINAFKIDGNTLLPQAEIDKLVAPYTGKGRDFGDVQRALEALQLSYQRRGYNSVQVLLPEQELEQGVVQLQVVEQRIASITVEGNEHYDEENVLRTIPGIREGVLPNMRVVQKSLRVANENPSKQAAILFRDSDDDETAINATVKVIDEKPWKAFLTVDNTGSRETGNARIGLGFQHYNLFNRDHRFTVQYITNNHWPDGYLEGDRKVNIIGGAYTIPFYEWGDSLDLIAGYSNVDSGSIQGAFTVSGKGVVLGAHYNHNFLKIGDYEHKLIASFDHRYYRSDVLNNGGNTGLTPHVSAAPWGLAYAGLWESEAKRLSFSLGGSWNLVPNIYARGSSETHALYLAEDDYSRYGFGLDFYRPLGKTWQFHFGLAGQLSGDHLIPGEQFRIGGMDSVRGWHESVISGDKGYRFTLEAISPDFGGKVGEQVGLRGVLFYDQGHVNNNEGVDGTRAAAGSKQTISSVGAGLRFNYRKDFVARFDCAYVVDGDITKDNPNGSRKDGDLYGHVSLGLIW